jgi:hypothetical protein
MSALILLLPFLLSLLASDASAQGCEGGVPLHENPSPAEAVIFGAVTNPQVEVRVPDDMREPLHWFVEMMVDESASLVDSLEIVPGSYTIRHGFGRQFLDGERVALVITRRPDTREWWILFKYTLSDQDLDGIDEVYAWGRPDLRMNPRPTPENRYWVASLDLNLGLHERPPTSATWEDVLFHSAPQAPASIRSHLLPKKIHADKDSLIQWARDRNASLQGEDR